MRARKTKVNIRWRIMVRRCSRRQIHIMC